MTIDKKKIAGIVLAVLAGLAASGIIIWQPWNRTEPEEKEPVQKIEEDKTPGTPEEKGPALDVGGKEIACTIHEGGGWSIYVPEGWTVRQGPGGMWMSCGEASVEVWREDTADYDEAFAAVAAGEDWRRERLFYLADGTGGSWEVRCGASTREDWDEAEKLMIEVARTFQIDEDRPFENWRPLAEEPDWQVAEGMTVLFLDKDGFVLDDEVRRAVEEYMAGWPEETRALFTGQYHVEKIDWDSSYTELTDGYVNVFAADVSYELSAAGAETIGDWEFPSLDGYVQPPDGLMLAVYHNGDAVEKTKWLDEGKPESWPMLAAMLA